MVTKNSTFLLCDWYPAIPGPLGHSSGDHHHHHPQASGTWRNQKDRRSRPLKARPCSQRPQRGDSCQTAVGIAGTQKNIAIWQGSEGEPTTRGQKRSLQVSLKIGSLFNMGVFHGGWGFFRKPQEDLRHVRQPLPKNGQDS